MIHNKTALVQDFEFVSAQEVVVMCLRVIINDKAVKKTLTPLDLESTVTCN